MAANPSKSTLTDSLSHFLGTERLGVFLATMQGIAEANDVYLNMAGYTREEMEAGLIDWRAMTPPEHLALDERGLQELRERGVCVPFETEHILRDGTRLPILTGAIRLKERPLEWLCWVFNLRARKEALQAEAGSDALQAELDAELAGAYWISEISGRMWGKSSVSEVLNEILDGAIALTGADFGNIQLLDAGVLRIVAQRNFPPAFLEFFRDVTDDTASTCSAALQCRSRVIIEDVETHALFRNTLARDILLNTGVRAVQSTPLIGSTGELYGMLSTQFRKAGHPSERALRYLDLLAVRAGQVLEKLQYFEIERRAERLRASAEFANALAHEINNPVQALMNIHSLLSSQSALSEETQQLLGTATEQLRRVEKTLRRLLAVDLGAASPKSPGLVKLIDQMREGSGLAKKAGSNSAK